MARMEFWSPAAPVHRQPLRALRVLTGAWGGTVPEQRRGARQAHLRGQHRRTSRRCRGRRGCGRRGRHPRPGTRRPLMADVRRGGALRRREPRRPVDPRCGRLRDDQRGRHPDLLESALEHGDREVRARLHRRGLRLDRGGQLGRGAAAAPMPPTRRTPPRRPPATCSPAPTTAPTGCRCRITRCSNNYGPYQFPEKVIPLFVTNLIDGAEVPLYGEGANVRDWLHVDDHCRGSTWCSTAAAPARSTTSAAAPS